MIRRSSFSEIKIDLKKTPTFNTENLAQDATQIITTTNLISTEDGQLIPRDGTYTVHTIDLSTHPELKDAQIIYSGFITNANHILVIANNYTEISSFELSIQITESSILVTSNIAALQKALIATTKIKLIFQDDDVPIDTLILNTLQASIEATAHKTQIIFTEYPNKQQIYNLANRYTITPYIEILGIYIISNFIQITQPTNNTSFGEYLASTETCDILRESDNELLISISSLGVCLLSWDNEFNFQLKDLFTEYKLEQQEFLIAKTTDIKNDRFDSYEKAGLCIINFLDLMGNKKQYLLIPVHPKYPIYRYQKNVSISISIIAQGNNVYTTNIPITSIIENNISYNRYIPETITVNSVPTTIFNYLIEYPEWNYNNYQWNGQQFLIKNPQYAAIINAIMEGTAPQGLMTVYYNSQITVGQNFGSAYYLAEQDENNPTKAPLEKMVFEYIVNPDININLTDYERLKLFFSEQFTFIRVIGNQNSIQITSPDFEKVLTSENTTIRNAEQPIPLIKLSQIQQGTTPYLVFDITDTTIANVVTNNIEPQDHLIQSENQSQTSLTLQNTQYFPIPTRDISEIMLKIPPPPLNNLFKAHGFTYGLSAAKVTTKDKHVSTTVALFKTTEKNDGKSWFNINTGNYNAQELNAPYFYTTGLNLETNNLPHSIISFYNYLLIISTKNIQVWKLNDNKENKKNADTLVEKYIDTLTIGATNKNAIFKTGSAILIPSNTLCNLLTINSLSGFPETVNLQQFTNIFNTLNNKYDQTIQFNYCNIDRQHFLFINSPLDNSINEVIIFTGQITQTSTISSPRISYFNNKMIYINNVNVAAPNDLFISNDNHNNTLDIIRLSNHNHTDNGNNIECSLVIKLKAPKHKIWRNESITFSYSSLAHVDITAEIEVININGAPPSIKNKYTLTKTREILPGANGSSDLLFGVANKHTYQTMLPVIFEDIILKINISTNAIIFIENLNLYGLVLN